MRSNKYIVGMVTVFLFFFKLTFRIRLSLSPHNFNPRSIYDRRFEPPAFDVTCCFLPPLPTMSYQPIPTTEHDIERAPGAKSFKSERSSFRVKTILSRVLAAFVIMYLALAGLRSLKLSPSYSSLGRFGLGCHKNASMKAGLSTLPSHYKLPSGDQIPSVALGTVNSTSFHLHSEHGLMQVYGRPGKARLEKLLRYVKCLRLML